MVATTIFSIPPTSWFSLDSGYGCVVSSGHSSWWTNNCPSDLVERIKEAHAKSEIVYNVSVASNGDWFFSTNAFNTAKVFSDASQSRVSKLLRKAINGGVNCNMSNVKWITFVPGADGYVGVTVVDGIERCWYEGVPQSLETHLSSLKSKTVRSVSVGQGNSWIVVHQDGSSSWDRVPDVLANKLNAGYRSTVESVVLSPKEAGQFIISYEDGASCYALPAAWRPAISKQEGLLLDHTARALEQANVSAAIMCNAAVNTSYMASASAMSSVGRAFATQSSGIF